MKYIYTNYLGLWIRNIILKVYPKEPKGVKKFAERFLITEFKKQDTPQIWLPEFHTLLYILF